MATTVSEFKIEEFTPLTAGELVWKRYFTYQHQRNAEYAPDDPTPQEESLRKRVTIQAKDPNSVEKRFFFSLPGEGGRIAGAFLIHSFSEASPSYEGNKHVLLLRLGLLKEFQHDINLVYEALRIALDFMNEWDKEVLISGTDEDFMKVHFRSFGANEAMSGAESRLLVTEVDWDMIQDWVDEGQKRSPDTSLLTFRRIPDDLIEEFCKVCTETLNQQPMGELETKEIIITPDYLRHIEEELRQMGTEWTIMVTKEPGGKISSLTEIRFNPDRPTFLSQGLTGVQETFRGRGLGKWVKAAMMLYVRETYPQVERLVTGNNTTNAPMLSINHRLGYKLHKVDISFQIKKSELENIIMRE